MQWLSHDVEHLIEICRVDACAYAPEVLVVGSGYGGAVAALRFAEHGLDVAVLERGTEYVAGEFPSDLGQIGSFVRAEWAGKHGTVAAGYEAALFDFRAGTRASALVGNGLGGGSLINAAVALRPDPRVFAQEAWPGTLRGDCLDQDFLRAYEGLEIQSAQIQRNSPACVPQSTPKYQRLQEIGQAAKKQWGSAKLTVSTEDVPLAIEFRADTPLDLGPRAACIGCGDCCSGCNHDAKLSLNKTYLPRAKKAGARLYTGVSVLHVENRPDAQHPQRDWVVHCVRTSERGTWEQACQLAKSPGDPKAGVAAAYVFTVRVGRVVLSAGTFGSTEILLRSKAMGLPVADAWLGRGISANGDDLSAAFDLNRETNAVGEGSGPAHSDKVGPTISGVIRFHDHEDHTRSTVTEDGGLPGMLAPLVGEILCTLGMFPQLLKYGLRSSGAQDPLAVRPDAVTRSLVMLGMGHDSAAGQARLTSTQSRLSWSWDEQAKDAAPKLHRARMACVEDLGAEFLPNPVSGLLPDKIASVLSGPAMGGGWITVHPLGGCRMGSSPRQGVVNHMGQVFLPNGEVHAGLLVMDGSVMPTSLGVNPLWTITALAERSCRLALAAIAAKSAPELNLPSHPSAPEMFKAVPQAKRGAILAEVLRGSLTPLPSGQPLPPWLHGPVPLAGRDVALFLEMDVQDWTQLWQDPSHTVAAVSGKKGARSFTASRLVVGQKTGPSLELAVTGGQVQLFRAPDESRLSRCGRLVRTALTYAIHRLVPDHFHPVDRPRAWRMLIDGPKVLWHASAARAFDYRLEISDGTQTYRLLGSKLIQPALSWAELGQWCAQWLRHGGWPALQRRSVWQQLTQLDVQLFAGAAQTPLADGRLCMDIPEMVRRIAPQMKPGPDTVQALAAFSSYPLMVLRYLIGSRLLDFRLPDYRPGLPALDPAALADDGLFELPHDKYPELCMADGTRVRAQAPVCLSVPLHAGTTPEVGSADWIRIGLVRYAQPHTESVVSSDGMRRFKSIILFNGFAQNALPFVAEELGARSLAAMLYAQGWDVWLLEYRVSPFLHASARFSSMDDIAACDIPAAVKHVLGVVQAQRDAPELLPGQVFVFSHCVGSASMAMSLMGGHLTHPDGRPKVAGVLLSQFQPYVIGSVTAQMRLQVAAILVNALGLEFVEFAAGTAQADALHATMDRVFASFDYAADERCPGEHDLRDAHPDSTSCKRMAGFLSRLFRHDQLVASTPAQRGTHEKLDEYFGRTNLGVFLHGAKCVDYERLVDADGQNIYVTDHNVRKYLGMPVMLLHGEDNVLFDKESLQETRRQFTRAFGARRLQAGHDRFLLAPGHAHFDCTIGKHAPEVIFTEVLDFFDNALRADVPAQEQPNRLRARLPRTGPLVGWCRREGDNNVFRAWMEVDNTQADTAVAAMTLVSAGKTRSVQAWHIRSLPMQGLVDVPDGSAQDNAIAYAVADVQVSADWTGPISIAMVSLHRFTADAPTGADTEPHAWPRSWGTPMTVEEATQSAGRSPAMTAPLSAAQESAHSPSTDEEADSPSGEQPVGGPIQPMPMQLGLREARALLVPLARLVRAQQILACRANPETLSRQRRTQRWMGESVLRLRGTQIPAIDTLNTAAHLPLRFFAATCRHPGITELEALRSDHTLEALATRHREQPAAFMWMLGDQIYADARAGLVDSTSCIERLLPRYRKAFGSPGFAALARTLPLYMVMDDHEIADNWSRDALALGEGENVLYHNALHAFAAFQRSHGPPALGPLGLDSSFVAGGAAFLCLNTRVHRHRTGGPQGRPSLLHAQQWNLLEAWLTAQQDKGKHPKFIVTGSVFGPGLKRGAQSPPPRDIDSWQLAQNERTRLLSFIADQSIDNVVFLSGDYHCSASATIAFSHSAVRAYCLVTPPLHAPMRFANVTAAEVLPHEVLALTHGTAQITAQAWNGEGWLECELQATASQAYTLRTCFRTLRMDAAQADHVKQCWHFG